MKFVLLLTFTIFLIGCGTDETESGYPHPLFNNNNSIDGDLLNMYPYQRISGGKGIIGEWHRTSDEYNRRIIIFNPNGSLTIKQQINTPDVFGNSQYIDNHIYNGTFSIESIENDNDNMVFFKIPWYTADTEFQVFVSDNYLVMKQYEGSPIFYEVLTNGFNVSWTRDTVFAVRVNYRIRNSAISEDFKAVPINNDSIKNTFIELPISELQWAVISVYSKKYWKYDGYTYGGYYNSVRIDF